MKSKILLGLAAVVVLAVAGYFIAAKMLNDQAYENFAKLMDDFVERDNWVDEGHSFNPVTGTLTVDKMVIGDGARSRAGQLNDDEAIKMDSLSVKRGLAYDDFKRVAGLDDWRGQKKTVLARGVTLRNLSVPVVTLKGAKPLRAEEVALSDIILNEAGQDSLAGPASFLSAASLGGLAIKGLEADVVGGPDKAPTKFSLTSWEARGLSFDEALVNVELKEFLRAECGDMYILAGLKIDSFLLEGLAISRGGQTGPAEIKIGRFGFEGLKGPFISDKFYLKDFFADFKPRPGEEVFFKARLGQVEAKGLDMTEHLMNYFRAYAGYYSGDRDAGLGALLNMNTMASLFVYPVGMDSLKMADLDVNIAEALGFKLREGLFAGPVKAGQLPKEQKFTISGFEIILPESEEAARRINFSMVELFRFGRDFGMNKFVLDYESASAYDAQKRLYKNDFTLAAKDLMELKSFLEVGGLDQKRVDALAAIPQAYLFGFGAVALREEMGDLSINEFTLNIKAEKLLDRLYNYAAVQAGGMGGAEDMQGLAQTGFALWAAAAAGKLEDPQAIVKPVSVFLDKRGDLTLRIKPTPPLSFPSLEQHANDASFVNSLGLTLRNNDEPPYSVKFKEGANF